MTTRPTKTVQLSGEHTLVIYEYATGRDNNTIQNTLMRDIKVGMGGGGAPQMDGFNPSAVAAATEKTIELLVVSLDGDSTDVVNKVLDLPSNIYEEVIDALNEVSGKKKIGG